ncbi:MAG: ATP-dependent RecD-like DNA helicase [Desulfosalsimonadaceae bacterium]
MTHAASGPAMIVLEGHLESITFRNEATKYTVARFKTGTAEKPLTVVGFLNNAVAGQALKLTGKWVTHPRYGQQFDIAASEMTVPAGIDGIREYLKSGIIRGIGPATVSRIIDHFGEDTIHVLNHDPDRLMQVSGIGKSRAASIAGQWRDHCTVSEIMNFLQQHGIKGAYGPKIYNRYGAESIEILTQTPYRLAEEMGGTGFYIADTIARRMGVAPCEADRTRACIDHVLREGASAGHIFLPLDRIIRKMQTLFEIDPDTAADAVEALAAEEKIIIENIPDPENGLQDVRGVFSPALYHAEKQIAQRIAAMQTVAMDRLPVEKAGLMALIEDRFLLRLSEGQRLALETVLSSRVSVITGGPGTGKTTLIKSIAAAFSDRGKRVCLAAPTGRAARRISELTLRPAHTIHKLLGFHFASQRFEKSTDDPVDADVIIVDEASMIDTVLMHQLVLATRLNARLILVGDMFQLPPVGPGNILSDIIESDTVPVCHLNEIFRQAGESRIVTNAHLIREGMLPDLAPFEDPTKSLSEFVFIEADTPETISRKIVALCTETLPQAYGMSPCQDIQVLSPIHKGEAGTINLNTLLQAALNPEGKSTPGMVQPFKPGDRVMHVKNNYQKEVFNGDTGIVTGVDPVCREITVDFYGRLVTYTPEDVEELTLGYAITIHKSQGSEYPAIIMPLTTKHYTMLQRNLLYTAVTRARNVVVMVGSRKALSVALRNNRPQQRLTSLSGRLRAACGHTLYA